MERQLRSDLHAPARYEEAITPDSPRHLVDVVFFRSALVSIGRWRCPVDHPDFCDSGPAENTLFVFPRSSVIIQHDGGTPFVADANTVTFYNRGQRYRRGRVHPWGDRCEWYAIAPALVGETLAVHDPAARHRLDRLFPFTHGPVDATSYLQQRLVFEHVSREAQPDRLFVEETMIEVLARVSGLAYHGVHARPDRRGAMRPRIDVAEAARDLIARRFRQDLSLSEIASRVGTSVFHLARTFRSRTGFSLHQYRNQLRLRAALEYVSDSRTELSALALDLGFSSHSHFTETFRRTFGRTPSSLRAPRDEDRRS